MTELLSFELSRPNAPSPRLPDADVKGPSASDALPKDALRAHSPELPRLSEPEIMRHYSRLASLNYSISENFYPLGSCTMKYNPVANEAAAALPGYAGLHPYQDEDTVQGALELMWRLERALCAGCVVDRVPLQPAAGAHGEWTALRMIQAYHRSRGEPRDEVLVPDSAHGTNPASATLSRLKTVTVKSGPDGLVDLEDFKSKISTRVAAVMLTNPNTFGLFEKDILEISRLSHEQGVQLYYDGANLNALVGIARPGDMGFDVVHLNLHKTFSTPHGGGGPGAGPVGVKSHLVPFLPIPTVERTDEGFRFEYERPQSIGKVRSFYGNFGMLLRAYAYIRTYGNTINEVAQNAVLNASYLRHHLRRSFDDAFSGPALPEVVLTAEKAKAQGVSAKDIAKRLIDLRFHPPPVH